MGVGGTLEYFFALLGGGRSKKKQQLQTVELKVRMDCEGCALKVKRVLSSMKGVKAVDVDLKLEKATVVGHVEPHKVLNKARSMGKKVELWPYVPYNLVAQPYAPQAYDKKAPSGYVRNVEEVAVRQEDQFTTMFSDDNPNSCSLM